MSRHELSKKLDYFIGLDANADKIIREHMEECARLLNGFNIPTKWARQILGLSSNPEPKTERGRRWKWICEEHSWHSNECACPSCPKQEDKAGELSPTHIIGALSLTKDIKSEVDRGKEMHKLLFSEKVRTDRELLAEKLFKDWFPESNSWKHLNDKQKEAWCKQADCALNWKGEK